MGTWRLLFTWERPPGFNMALDEALLVLPEDATVLPTLRFYTWEPAALSLGYFQRARDVPNLERAPAAVRRLTGGGAIHHGEELTFSIVAPATHPLYVGPVRDSYVRVHGAIGRALATFGVAARERGDARLRSDVPDTGMCFEHSTDIDLAWNEAKGVGSAQRRTNGRVLHHGSIKLARTELDASVAAIRDVAPDATATDVAHRIVEELRASFALDLVAGEPTPAEARHARERAAFFESDAFVRRR